MKWYLKQLIPLKYKSSYFDYGLEQMVHVTWWMWFGKVFWQQMSFVRYGFEYT